MIVWLQRLDRINERVGRGVAWLTLAMVIMTVVVVVLRYLFNQGSIAMQESITYMHGMLFMLGAGYTLRHDGHVRVDLFYRPRSAKAKAWVNLLGTLLLLLPLMIFLLLISFDYVAASWSIFEGSHEAGGLDGVWLLKSVLLIMPALMMVQGLAQVGKALLILRGHEVPGLTEEIHEQEGA
ncbi:Tripartite ATP-independent periplasmic transporter, DctQ component [Magnetococcus marinus MC-1]|uniref:TRAP transporter small permease protein n=1 Tax=Magnetococcus marinus (strain ATCC BAA-1437 / JCM 17883 / MC-1) TaxID=156889 RepID=A0L828_MAGMM|nr:TRAP transporter small permease subunit [Magnetococcus marinus]ABK44121.1 Tripartite ATP-independent periplasmic transporter, DctQ component [Magnetococcus marinus MC-1]